MEKNYDKKPENRPSFPELEDFFASLETKYQVTRKEILDAVSKVGPVKSRLSTYFQVEMYLKKKGRY